jgi:hypothetical protein
MGCPVHEPKLFRTQEDKIKLETDRVIRSMQEAINKLKRGKGVSIHAISRIEKAVINIALVYFQRIKLHLIAGKDERSCRYGDARESTHN